MTPEKQRIAIAEACGWIHQPIIEKAGWGCNAVFPHYAYAHQLPDYLNDLNAMAAAEKVLRNDQFNYTAYWKNLFQVVAGKEWAGDIGYFHFEMAHATAAQRAEAFLKTLGLWTED